FNPGALSNLAVSINKGITTLTRSAVNQCLLVICGLQRLMWPQRREETCHVIFSGEGTQRQFLRRNIRRNISQHNFVWFADVYGYVFTTTRCLKELFSTR